MAEEERTLIEKVHAAIHFGTPSLDVTDEILSGLTEWTRNEHPKVKWHPSDLDRCQHGRHSVDSCFDCPGGQSSGNLFLDPLAGPKMRETRLATNEFRIGTMVHGEPIFVCYRKEVG